MEKGFWKKILVNASIYFSIVSAVIFAVYLVLSQDGICAPVFSVFRMLMILCFCVMFAIANRILSSKELNSFWKLVIHSILTAAAFFTFIYAPMVADGKYQAEQSGVAYKNFNIFVIIGLFIVIYGIGYGIYFAISSKHNKKKNEKSEYKSLYRDKSSK